jgi:hypothetical protein
MSLTYKAVQERLRKAGVVISKRGCVHRINFFGGLETTAYYTESLQDALEKGLQMARPRPARPPIVLPRVSAKYAIVNSSG